jgi:predicted DNA-binding ribbon-helix-helix protein
MNPPVELATDMTDRYQISITLSKKSYEQYKEVSDWKDIPMATLLRQILEREQESPAFASLYRRASAKE